MTILADSRSPPKQLSESSCFSCDGSKSDVFRGSKRKCCAAPTHPSDFSDVGSNYTTPAPSHFKCSNLNFKNFGEKSDLSATVKKLRCSYALRSLQSSNMKQNPEKSVTSHRKEDGVGEKLADNIVNAVGQPKNSWDFESEKLAAVVVEAQKFISIVDDTCFVSKCFKADQEGKPSGMETEGDNDEKDVSVLSPEEWSKYHKNDGAKASAGKTEERMEKFSSQMSSGEFYNIAESQGAETDEKGEMVFHCDLKYFGNHNELINLQIGKHDQPQHFDVMETLKLFDQQYIELNNKGASEFKKRKFPKPACTEAGERVKAMGKCISVEKPFGHVPGIEIGDKFRFRTELALVGLHRQLVSGISYVDLNGMICATSIVDSMLYKNTANIDKFMYSAAPDQNLGRGILALMNSKEMDYPVRVIFYKRNLRACATLGTSDVPEFVYVYDGLYTVNKHWAGRGENGKFVYKVELLRLLGQPRPRENNARPGKPVKRVDVCVRTDVSLGKEIFPIRAINGVDDDMPPPFTYITKVIYPYGYHPIEPIGCNCTNGCSDSKRCACVLKNGDEIPFNEDGAILRVMPRVHECGPLCKCPPSCMNRVSQHGPRFQLEIFKTKSRGWGVRSRDSIRKGSFICEYVGELLWEKEAEIRVDNDDYLFDICNSHDEGGQEEENGFVLDCAKYGNIGRFINHSCSPNLFAQEVLYDHDDKRIPHIMFFASKNVHPLEELNCDYNYKDPVFDVDGNTKIKNCYCDSRKCSGRMY